MYKLTTILTVVLFSSYAFAEEFNFVRINGEQGLSQNNVLGILQDSDGYMWFATYDGLNRYDGYNFKVFRTSDDTNSLSDNLVQKIVEDSNGFIWVSTLSHGLCRYDKTSEQFTRFLNTPDNPNLIAGNQCLTLTVDSRNNIWLGTTTGISCFIQEGDKVKEIITLKHDDTNPKSLHNNHVNKIFEDNDGKIWVCTNRSLNLLMQKENGEIENNFQVHLSHNDYDDLSDMVQVPEGYVVLYNFGALLFKPDYSNQALSIRIPLGNISSSRIIKTPDGNLLIGGHNGLYLFEHRPRTRIPYVIKNHITEGEGERFLSNSFIRSLYYDDNNILWIGTSGGGILKYNPNRTRFRHYQKTSDPGSLARDKVWCFHEDQEKNLWIGTENGLSLLTYDQKHNYKSGFTHFRVAPPGVYSVAFDIIQDPRESNNGLLFGSSYFTLVGELKKYGDNWRYNLVMQDIIDQVMKLYSDSNGTIWLGSYQGGLGKYKEIAGQENLLIYKTNNSTIPSNIIRNIFEDSKGRLWIGTPRGLMLLTPEQKLNDTLDFTLFVSDMDDTTSLSNNYIVPILETSDNEIWIGTFGGGLNVYHEGTSLTNGAFSSITVKDGLPNNTIKSMVEDNYGNIWITSNKGLTRIDKSRKNIRNFTTKDGLQNLEFMDLAGYKRHDGEILFGGVAGFNAFYPENIGIDSIPPKLVLIDIEVMNQLVKVNEPIDGNIILRKNVNCTDTIILKHTQNNFKLFFAALQFTEPEGNRFKYMLEGFDSDWIHVTNNARFATYTNLSIGQYKFLLSGSNSDGIWNETPKELLIWIKPPFWLTIWFKISFPIFILLLGSTLIWFRFRQVKQQNIWLESKVKKRTLQLSENNALLNETNALLEERQQVIEEQSEELRVQKESLEDMNSSKDKFFSIISHDLKGPFNTTLGFLELLKANFDKYDKDEIKNSIDLVFDSAQHSLSLVKNLLSWSRTQRGIISINPEPIIVHDEVNEVLKIQSDSAHLKGVTLLLEMEDKKLGAVTDGDILKTILNNLVSNAIKFTSNGDKVKISIRAENENICIKVADNGVGIPKHMLLKLLRIDSTHSTAGTNQERGTGLGLILCKEFVELLGGTISIDSTEGVGTTVNFSILKEVK